VSSPPSGIPTRETTNTYQTFSDTLLFPNPSIFDRPAAVKVYDGNGSLTAETDYAYDGTSVSSVSATEHDDTNYGTGYNNRGNATTKTARCFQTGCSNAITTYTYDQTGQITLETDPCGNPNGTCSDVSGSNHTTAYSYANNFTVLSGGQNTSYTPSGNTNAYLSQITDQLGHQSSFTYDYWSGQLTGSKDQNDISASRAGTTYIYNDLFSRPSQVNYPDGGQINIVYNDTPPSPTVTTCQLISGSPTASCSATNPATGWKTRMTRLDGMGHLTQTQLASDPDGTVFSDTAYDGLGRVYTQSNPHRSSGGTTDGVTTFTYDAMGRTTSVKQSDGSDVDTNYSGNCTAVTDETGAGRRSCSDSFGRLIEVDEPGAGAQTETAGSATITISGSEQSGTGSAAAGSGSVTINGAEGAATIYPCGVSSCPTLVYDTGDVYITVNGFKVDVGYGNGTYAYSIAHSLASLLSSTSSPVTASVNGTYGTVVSMTAKATGASTNYLLSTTSSTSQPQYFSQPSFYGASSGSTLTGGEDAGTFYDSGTVSIAVNGFIASASYGQGSTTTSIASALTSAFSVSGSPVSASVSGNTITISATVPGSESNLPLTTSNTHAFSQPSFTASSASSLTGGTDGSVGSNPPVTLYSYNAMNDLTCVVQKGTDITSFTTCAAAPATWRPRSFVYDSLSRLTSAKNPESGTITYSYDANSNVSSMISPKPGQLATATTTHNYAYDVENRRIQESHINPYDGNEKYGYDGVTLTGCSGPTPGSVSGAVNLVHRTSAICSNYSASAYSYDPMGRLTTERRSNKGSSTKTYNVVYSLWKDGSLNTLTYPSGNVITYQVGGAGRATKVSDATNTYANSATYAPHGELVGMTSGSGIITSNVYNNRLQPTLLSAGLNGQSPFLSLCYDFHSGVAINSGPCVFNAYTSGNNGNVFQVIDKYDSTRSAMFAYDRMNRITQANTVNTTSTNCWGEVFTLDNWGNLTHIDGVPSMGSCWHETLTGPNATNLNQLSNFCHDAAGNLLLANSVCPTASFTPSYAYDAENRLSSTAGYSYYYDAGGVRIEKSNGTSGTMYWVGPGGEYLTETDLTGSTINEEYVYFNGERLARIDRPSGTVHYYFSDKLNSASTITDPSGNVQERYYYYPYGGLVTSIGSDSNHYRFTGKERDSESGLDNFGARYDASSLGRFMTPDWAAKPTTVPYALFGDPQTLNLYAYVRNNPVSRADADGHCADHYQDGTCKVNVDSATGQAGAKAGKQLEGVLNKYDKAVNALNNKDKFNIKDSKGNVIGSMTGKEIKAVWNGTSFEVTNKSFNNGGAGGGTGGTWNGDSFSGRSQLTPGAVSAYANAASARNEAPDVGLNSLTFHELGHETHFGEALTQQYPVTPTISWPREQGTSSAGRRMSDAVGAPFDCSIPGGCQ
jgi:RHS repeat-associated protein